MAATLFISLGGEVSQAFTALKKLTGADRVVVFLDAGARVSVMDESHDWDQLGSEPEFAPMPDEEFEVRYFVEDDLQRFCDALSLDLVVHKIHEDESFEEVLTRVLTELRSYRGRHRSTTPRAFHLTSTGLTLAAACLTACMLEGVQVQMSEGASGNAVRLPLLKMRYDVNLTPAMRKTLDVLSGAGAPPNVTALAAALRIKKSTLSERLDAMESLGLVQRRRGIDTKREVYVELTDEGRLLREFGRGAP